MSDTQRTCIEDSLPEGRRASLVFDSGELFRKASAIRAAAGKCVVEVREETVTLRAMNAPQTLRVDATLTNVEWDTDPVEFDVSMETDQLLHAAEWIESGETTTLNFHGGEQEGTATSGIYLNYFDYRDASDVDLAEPNTPDGVEVSVPGEEYKLAVGRAASLEGRGLVIGTGEGGFYIAPSERLSAEQKSRYCIPNTAATPEVEQSLSRDRVQMTANATALDDTVTVRMDGRMPPEILVGDEMVFTIAPHYPAGGE